jgi:hypothetical protein
VLVGGQEVERRAGALAQLGALPLPLARLGGGRLGVGGADALAIDVGGEGDVAEAGQHVGAALGLGGDAHPVVHHHDPGLLGRPGLVVGQVAFEGGVAVLVLDGLGVKLGVRRAGDERQQRREGGGKQEDLGGEHGGRLPNLTR